MINPEQIKLKDLSQDDLRVMNEAATKYAEALEELANRENKSQQHIHYSILHVYRLDIVKKFTRRNIPMKNSLTLEVYAAFVAFDSLQYFQQLVENELYSAIARRISMELYRDLPNTTDSNKLSIGSELNFKS